MFVSTIVRWLSRSPKVSLFEPDPVVSTAAPAAAPAGAPAAPAAPSSDGTPAAAAAAPAGAPAPKAKPTYSYSEDRSKWVPPHRVVEASTRVTTLQKELELERQRVAALAGTRTQTPEDLDQAQIQEALFKLPQFAHLKGLTPEVLQDLIEMRQLRSSMEQSSQHVWRTLALDTTNQLESRYKDLIGADELTPQQSQILGTMFMGMAGNTQESRNEFRQRYESRDPKLMDEFFEVLQQGIIEPVRRTALAGPLRRPAVPRSGSATVVAVPPKIDYTNSTAVEDEGVRRMKEAGLLTQA